MRHPTHRNAVFLLNGDRIVRDDDGDLPPSGERARVLPCGCWGFVGVILGSYLLARQIPKLCK